MIIPIMTIAKKLFSKVEWSIQNQDAQSISKMLVPFTSVLEFSTEKNSRLPDEPIEKGSWANYNRVFESVTLNMRIAYEGTNAALTIYLLDLKNIMELNQRLTIITPSGTYKNMLLESFDYRRDVNAGNGVLFVDLRIKEIREVPSFTTTKAVEEPVEEEDTEDGSCADEEEQGEAQGEPATEAEEAAAEEGGGPKRSILKDVLG